MKSNDQQRRLVGRQAAGAVAATAVGFGGGALALVRGLRFVWANKRRLWPLVLPPMLICLALLAGGVAAIVHGVPDFIDAFWTEPSPEAWWGIKHALWRWLDVPVTLALGLLATLATLVVTFFTFALLAAAWSDALSERVEAMRGTFDPRPFSWSFFMRDLLESLKLELARLGGKLLWLLPLFVASLVIPVLGQVAYVVVGGYILLSRTGMDYIDWCGARRGWDHKKRLAFAKRHRPAMLGLGAAVLLTWTIPLAFVLLWPAAVAGGAILFTELQKEEDDAGLGHAEVRAP